MTERIHLHCTINIYRYYLYNQQSKLGLS